MTDLQGDITQRNSYENVEDPTKQAETIRGHITRRYVYHNVYTRYTGRRQYRTSLVVSTRNLRKFVYGGGFYFLFLSLSFLIFFFFFTHTCTDCFSSVRSASIVPCRRRESIGYRRGECYRSSLSAHPRPPYYRGWNSQHRHMSLTRLFLPLFLRFLFCRTFFPLLSHSFAPSLSVSLRSLPLPYSPFTPATYLVPLQLSWLAVTLPLLPLSPSIRVFPQEYEAGTFHVRSVLPVQEHSPLCPKHAGKTPRTCLDTVRRSVSRGTRASRKNTEEVTAASAGTGHPC